LADVYGWILSCDQIFGDRSVDAKWHSCRIEGDCSLQDIIWVF